LHTSCRILFSSFFCCEFAGKHKLAFEWWYERTLMCQFRLNNSRLPVVSGYHGKKLKRKQCVFKNLNTHERSQLSILLTLWLSSYDCISMLNLLKYLSSRVLNPYHKRHCYVSLVTWLRRELTKQVLTLDTVFIVATLQLDFHHKNCSLNPEDCIFQSWVLQCTAGF
jgi:hypothetical protein